VKPYFRPATALNSLKSALQSFFKSNPKLKWIIFATVFALIIWFSWGMVRSVLGLDAPKYRTVTIEEGPMASAIRASGTLNPVKQVTIGAAVSGLISEINADFNDVVKQGQTIARIDTREFQARYDQASANYELARKNHQFNLGLVNQGFISKQAVIQTEGAMKAAQGALNLAKKALDDTFIRSPVDGVVVKRNVEVGQTVAASLQAPELFIIAQNLAEMQVETSIDESDVGKIKDGQEATFTVDAFPGQTFQGKVRQIRKAPVNIQNVVTYTVLISADNPDLKLLPGMTANARIVTDQRDRALKVANAALRFRLPENLTPADAKADQKIPTTSVDQKSSKSARPLAASGGFRRVWVLEKSGLKDVLVRKTFRAGITDGESTEMLPAKEGQELSVKAGDRVIVGIEGSTQNPKPAAGPRMF
jgi:HlyD family secretion protein